MENKLVSIIVPIYNVGKYLEVCIESILNQDYEDIEVILVNDGSTDNSSEICRKYISNKKVVYIEQKNSGVSVARNKGIKLANGRWLMFVDGDDYMSTNMVSQMVNIAEKENCDLLITPPVFEYEDRCVNGIIFEKDCDFLENKDKIEINIICRQFQNKEKNDIGAGGPWGKLYNANLIKDSNSKFIVGLKRMQDVIFNLNFVGKTKKILYRNINLYHYRINSNSVCVKYNPKIFEIFYDVMDEFDKFVDFNKKNDTYRQAIYMKKILMYIEGVRISVMHQDNSDTFWKKVKALKEIYSSEKIMCAFKKIDYNNLDYKMKIFVFMCNMKLFSIVYFMIMIFMKSKLKEQN